MARYEPPPFTVGIEEEYLLVDPATGELVIDARNGRQGVGHY